ncbi:uncharacterized protein LOC127520216 [Ctenopharyngodon idella]|uniref:uncharacterized protein LOC127520216 n=1 Tax=Ctenopharyngodon idella TaxID=7959 RepID=UPI0022317602|nr:uncharacterized protein LOC127520216 [Ctenopharyngodon idella]
MFSTGSCIILICTGHENTKSASGVDTDEVSVSVMEGESVTLHTGVKTNQQEDIKWYFNKTRLAQISGDQSKICTDVQCEERFRDRLKLDHQTGSLTITNTTNTDSGLYKLWINSSSSISPKIFNVTVTAVPDSGLSSGAVAGIVVVLVFAAAAAVTVGVIYCRKCQAGQKDGEMQAEPDQENHVDDSTPDQTDPLMKNAANGTSPNQTEPLMKNAANGKSPNQTEPLMKNAANGTSPNQSDPLMKNAANGTSPNQTDPLIGASPPQSDLNFLLFVEDGENPYYAETPTQGVSGVDIKIVSVGDSVTLNTSVETNQQEDIIWYFNNIRIAQITENQSKICTDDQCDERFRDRLKLDNQTGSLTITNTRNTDSGEYKLVLISNSNNPEIFNVTVSGVPDSGLSSGAVAVIVVAVQAFAAAAVTVGVIYCRKRQAGQKDGEMQAEPDQENHVDDSTPDQTVPLMNAANETSPHQTDTPKKDTSNGTSPNQNKIPLMDTDNETSSNPSEAAEEASL